MFRAISELSAQVTDEILNQGGKDCCLAGPREVELLLTGLDHVMCGRPSQHLTLRHHQADLNNALASINIRMIVNASEHPGMSYNLWCQILPVIWSH